MKKISKIILTAGVLAFSSPFALANSLCGQFASNQVDPALNLGDHVCVFSAESDMAAVQQTVDNIYQTQQGNQFGHQSQDGSGYALLFKPGSYPTNIKVGFYTQVLGLGITPDATNINGIENKHLIKDQSTQEFWRSVENFHITGNDATLWAVSQAAPMRKINSQSSFLVLGYGGHFSSGGFIANSNFANISSDSQQQWLSQDSTIGNWYGGVWNMVFVNDQGGLPADSPWGLPMLGKKPNTVINDAPTMDPKPYLTDKNGTFGIIVPKKDGVASSFIPSTLIYIAKPSDSAATINQQLADKKNIIFQPGVYKNLQGTITVNNPNTVLLGLGVPTLVSSNGLPIMTVKTGVGGVKIGGIIYDAGSVHHSESVPSNLLEVGTEKDTTDNSEAASYLYDVYCRVGGDLPNAKVKNCFTINNNNVVGDNLWIWRADHGDGVSWTDNSADTGIVINGNNVTMYGLAVEHFLKYQTVWNGDHGKLYFYQSEMPYSASSHVWRSHNNTVTGYASLKFGKTASHFEGYGIGIYTFFRDHLVNADNAIEAPNDNTIHLKHIVTRWLDGQHGSGIDHIVRVINDDGGLGVAVGDPITNGADPVATSYYDYWQGQNAPVKQPLEISAHKAKPSLMSADVQWTINSLSDLALPLKSVVMVNSTAHACHPVVSTTNPKQATCDVKLDHLNAGTRYPYTISVSDAAKHVAADVKDSFTTTVIPVTAVTITKNAAVNINLYSADITWTVDSSDNLPIAGMTSSVAVNGSSYTCHAQGVSDHEATCLVHLAGLQAETPYDYAISAVDHAVKASDVKDTFTTASTKRRCLAPVIIEASKKFENKVVSFAWLKSKGGLAVDHFNIYDWSGKGRMATRGLEQANFTDKVTGPSSTGFYKYFVSAQCGSEESASKTEVKVSSKPTPPSAGKKTYQIKLALPSTFDLGDGSAVKTLRASGKIQLPVTGSVTITNLDHSVNCLVGLDNGSVHSNAGNSGICNGIVGNDFTLTLPDWG